MTTSLEDRKAGDALPRGVAEKSLLKQQAYDALKRSIQNATFEPGTFLSERQLAAQLGMSKTPVKAALERLEAEGFVAVSPQQGIVVRDLSIHELADQFEIRLALETFVLRAMAGKLSESEAGRVVENLRWQQEAAAACDIHRAVQLDADFHALFCEYFGNQEILRVMTQLRDKIHRAISRVLEQDPERLNSSYREHRAIAEAVLEGDGERAARALKEHLNYGKQFLLSPNRR